MRFFVRRHLGWPWIAALSTVACAALIIGSVIATASGALIPLGQGGSPAERATPVLPRPVGGGDVHRVASTDEPAAPDRAAASVGSVLMSEQVFTAFDCARGMQSLPAFQRDAQLDREAASILQRLVRNPDSHLEPGEHGYTLTGQLLLDAGVEPEHPCEVGGFDIAAVADLDRAGRIGAAVEPVANAYGRPLYHAVVIGR
jgi:hypothetical protein